MEDFLPVVPDRGTNEPWINGEFPNHCKGSVGWLKDSSTQKTRLQLKQHFGDFPGGPVGKTPCSQCWGPGFDPWWGTRSHMHAATKSLCATTKRSHMPQQRPGAAKIKKINIFFKKAFSLKPTTKSYAFSHPTPQRKNSIQGNPVGKNVLVWSHARFHYLPDISQTTSRALFPSPWN